MVSTIWSLTLAQVPLPLAVSVKVTAPVSPTPGWYVGVNVFALNKVPVPVVVHSKLLKLLALAKVVWVLKLKLMPWHVSASLPALTIADGVMVSTIWSTAGEQNPKGLVTVNVNVTEEPASEGPKV
jgi:hypothetical protein